MASDARVIVYGATGYTGRLICEELKRRSVPFAMAGRNLARLEAYNKELGGAARGISAVPHTVADLTRVFRGHEVVINVTGPFGLLGESVVKAALDANCHYLDTTGEQDFMLAVKERFGRQAEEKKRVVVNANSWYFGPGEAAAHYLRQRFPHLDTYNIVYCPLGTPTIASTQSLLRVARRPGFSWIEGKLEPNRGLADVSIQVPGEVLSKPAFLMPGGEALHFASEPGVRNVRVYMASELVPRFVRLVRIWTALSKVFGDLLDPLGDRLVLWFWKTPPPEDPAQTRFVVMAAGESEGDRKICVLYGSRPYVITGVLCGWAAQRLLAGAHKRVGVISTAQAFGAEETLEILREAGTSHRVIE
ncbi:MAG: saccharopine dehydrogenase NADP-binding domain-containing protein [Nitrospirae bacterium]|nr:saccharopine dehydrogenase NADP-binding domain-containing protein [Nitrospirota bacterium]